MIEEEILLLFVKKKWTLSVAESCTGGLVASQLVKVAGASNYFLGGIVAYSNEAKEKLLQVPRPTLEKFGAVSEEVAIAMSKGAKGAFCSDIALSITGIAGPSGATAEKPVGLVCFAISKKNLPDKSWTKRFKGDRLSVIEQAASESLDHLFDYLNH